MAPLKAKTNVPARSSASSSAFAFTDRRSLSAGGDERGSFAPRFLRASLKYLIRYAVVLHVLRSGRTFNHRCFVSLRAFILVL
jgi:hypothetical protein